MNIPVLVNKSSIARELSNKIRKGEKDCMEAGVYIVDNFANGTLDKSLEIVPGTKAFKTTWNMIIDAAEKYNDPGDERHAWVNTTFFIGEGRILPNLGVEYRVWRPAWNSTIKH